MFEAVVVLGLVSSEEVGDVDLSASGALIVSCGKKVEDSLELLVGHDNNA